MRYLKVKWDHDNPTDPALLYSELDDARWEVRKVEVFLDGSKGYASSDESAKSTGLGLEPLPFLEDIAADPQFKPVEITKEEFETVWTARRSSV